MCIRNARAARLQKHLLQEDLIEDCLRDQDCWYRQCQPIGNRCLEEMRSWDQWWRVLKELTTAFRRACCKVSHLFPESVSLTLCHLNSNPQGQVGSGFE